MEWYGKTTIPPFSTQLGSHLERLRSLVFGLGFGLSLVVSGGSLVFWGTVEMKRSSVAVVKIANSLPKSAERNKLSAIVCEWVFGNWSVHSNKALRGLYVYFRGVILETK